jgi:hypothetical protein
MDWATHFWRFFQFHWAIFSPKHLDTLLTSFVNVTVLNVVRVKKANATAVYDFEQEVKSVLFAQLFSVFNNLII